MNEYITMYGQIKPQRQSPDSSQKKDDCEIEMVQLWVLKLGQAYHIFALVKVKRDGEETTDQMHYYAFESPSALLSYRTLCARYALHPEMLRPTWVSLISQGAQVLMDFGNNGGDEKRILANWERESVIATKDRLK